VKKIFISGNRASGKSTLLRLIDGNSKIEVIHHHDKIYSLINLFNNNNQLFNKIKKIVEEYNTNISKKKIGTLVFFKNKKKNFLISPFFLRKLLENTAFYEIEQDAWAKKIRINFDSSKLISKKFNFDFYKFEKLIFNKIFSKKKISVESLLDTFIVSYFEILNKKNYEFVCFMLPNNLEVIENIIEEKFNGKFIFIKRDVRGILIAEAIRNLYSQDYNFKNRLTDIKNLNLQIKKILFSKKIILFIESQYKIDKIANEYSKKIYIINFKELILKNKMITKKIFKFLNIKFQSVNNHTSLDSIKTNEKFGIINDDIYLNMENASILDFLKKKKIDKKNFLFVFKFYLTKSIFYLKKYIL